MNPNYVTADRLIALLALVGGVLTGCDGPRENAGEKADAVANVSGGAFGNGPQERMGEIQDRAARDQAKAIEAQADATEDRADEVRETGDQRAAVLERQAAEIRKNAARSGEVLDQQADATRSK